MKVFSDSCFMKQTGMERQEKGGLGEMTKVHEKPPGADGDAGCADHCDGFMDVHIVKTYYTHLWLPGGRVRGRES